MTNVVDLTMVRASRRCKHEIIDLKNKYFFAKPEARAEMRFQLARNLAASPFSPYFNLIKQAYQEVDNDAF